jgi:acyl-CoA synthetase (AMP-forming)/AMP-acid ligase II
VVRHPHNLGQFRELGPDSRMYTPMPLFWVGGLAYTLVAAIHAGAAVVFEERFEPGTTLQLLERERITHLTGWPHMGKALAEHPDYPSTDLSSITSSGLSDLLPARLRPADPELRSNSLGMTETFGPHSVEDRSVDWPESKRGTYGRAVPGVEHRIVDPMTGEELPAGEMGEVWVRGYSLMDGLLGVERSEAFTADGWLRTGDGGWLDGDGHLFFRGRLGEVIKSSGTNVTPREVELALEELPEVMHAFVLGIPHTDRGEDVAAAVVLRPGVEAGPDELRAAVKEVLSTYKVPRHLALFATPRDLPWLESGKIDRRAVQQLLVDEFAEQ